MAINRRQLNLKRIFDKFIISWPPLMETPLKGYRL